MTTEQRVRDIAQAASRQRTPEETKRRREEERGILREESLVLADLFTQRLPLSKEQEGLFGTVLQSYIRRIEEFAGVQQRTPEVSRDQYSTKVLHGLHQRLIVLSNLVRGKEEKYG